MERPCRSRDSACSAPNSSSHRFQSEFVWTERLVLANSEDYLLTEQISDYLSMAVKQFPPLVLKIICRNQLPLTLPRITYKFTLFLKRRPNDSSIPPAKSPTTFLWRALQDTDTQHNPNRLIGTTIQIGGNAMKPASLKLKPIFLPPGWRRLDQ